MLKAWIKRGARRPHLSLTLLDAAGAGVDLTAAAAVRLNLRRDGATTNTIAAGACTVDDAAAGVVSYAWGAGETAVAGRYRGEIVVDWGGDVLEVFPSDGYLDVRIVDGLA